MHNNNKTISTTARSTLNKQEMYNYEIYLYNLYYTIYTIYTFCCEVQYIYCAAQTSCTQPLPPTHPLYTISNLSTSTTDNYRFMIPSAQICLPQTANHPPPTPKPKQSPYSLAVHDHTYFWTQLLRVHSFTYDSSQMYTHES